MLVFTLMCYKWLAKPKMLSSRTPFEEHTYMSQTAGHSLWDLGYSWKALKYDLYASNRGDAFCCPVSAKDFSDIQLTQNCQFKV